MDHLHHALPGAPMSEALAGWSPARASENGQVDDATDAKFTPRKLPEGQERRALLALLAGPITREALDRACPASNAPDVVFRLRARGVGIDCHMRQGMNRHGEPCRYGVYALKHGQGELVAALLGGAHA
jgi:hypothetical protein